MSPLLGRDWVQFKFLDTISVKVEVKGQQEGGGAFASLRVGPGPWMDLVPAWTSVLLPTTASQPGHGHLTSSHLPISSPPHTSPLLLLLVLFPPPLPDTLLPATTEEHLIIPSVHRWWRLWWWQKMLPIYVLPMAGEFKGNGINRFWEIVFWDWQLSLRVREKETAARIWKVNLLKFNLSD